LQSPGNAARPTWGLDEPVEQGERDPRRERRRRLLAHRRLEQAVRNRVFDQHPAVARHVHFQRHAATPAALTHRQLGAPGW
jgi:hypothetical protein